MKFSIALFSSTMLLFLGHTSGCGSSVYPLVAGGGNGVGTVVGHVAVVDKDSDTLEVAVAITGDLTPDDDSDDSSPTLVTKIHAEANCLESEFPINPKSGAIKNGKFLFNKAYSPGVESTSFTLPKPDCGGDPVLVAVHAEVEKLGGVEAFDYLFPADVEYTVTNDSGSDTEASYFDTEFVGDSHLNGLVIDGYCVDVENFIASGVTYSGTAYSYLETDLSGTNIDNPENLDLVAWVINTYSPGVTYADPDVNDGEAYVMSSGTLQLAIWYIIDFTSTTAGIGSFDDAWALFIAAAAQNQDGYTPGCGDLLPIVLVPDDGDNQHTIAQTTFAALEIPCDGSDETAWAVMPDMTPIGFQFASKNWATYVEYETCE